MAKKKAPEQTAVPAATTAAVSEAAVPHRRIIALQTENIKRISCVRIKPKGNMVYVSGANGGGKTSLLDSISYAIMGEKGMPSEPIRKGKNAARIQVDLGDFKVTRTFTRVNGGKEPFLTSLLVEGKDRQRFPTPQSIIDKLKGVISFDPLAFTNMDDKKQLETMRKLVTFDVDLDAIDAAKKDFYDKRRDAGRDRDGVKTRLKSAVKPPEGLPEKPIDTAELTKKLEGAATANTERGRMMQEKARLEAQAQTHRDRTASLQSEAAELRRRAEGLTLQANDENEKGLKCEEAEKKIKVPAEVDSSAVAAELQKAQVTNNNIRVRDAHAALERELAAAEKKFTTLDDKVKAKAKEREDALGRAKMPIEKLSIGEDEVLYDGLPLRQASNGEQIRVAVAMAMASNPELRVLRIMDGALLDAKSLEAIEKMADEHDFQVWIERVDTSGKVGIFMEDGNATGAEVEEATSVQKLQ